MGISETMRETKMSETHATINGHAFKPGKRDELRCGAIVGGYVCAERADHPRHAGAEVVTINTLANELSTDAYGLAEFAAEIVGGRSQSDPLTGEEADAIREAWAEAVAQPGPGDEFDRD